MKASIGPVTFFDPAPSTDPATYAIALRCDASPAIGVGHTVRCIALCEALQRRGHHVTLWGDLGKINWLGELVAAHKLTLLTAPAAAEQLAEVAATNFDAVVLDGYTLDPGAGAALRARGVRVLAMVDGNFGAVQQADVYVDQNLGARPHIGGPSGSTTLAGIDYALFRDSVLDRRRNVSPTQERQTREIISVLAVFGGLDSMVATPRVVSALLATGFPIAVTVITERTETATTLATLSLAAGQTLRTVPPDPDFAARAVEADLVISASGSSVWELLVMGVPTAVLCVIDNQELSYRETVAAGVVTGLGRLWQFQAAEVTTRLQTLFADINARHVIAARSRRLVDGFGRERVADAVVPSTSTSYRRPDNTSTSTCESPHS